MAELKPVSDEQLAAMDAAALEAEILRHNRLYWDDAAPEISDIDYDRLARRLKELAPESTVLDDLGSRAPAEPGDAVEHDPPMLSLDKCYTEEELRNWADKIPCSVIVTPKMDGVAAAIRYDEHGRLMLAATRGSGRVGENITANVLRIEDVPKRIPHGPLEVRGEAYMKLSVFERFKAEFSNPRNLTAGAVKQKDADKSAAYGLSFAAYGARGVDLATEEEKFAYLEKVGFPGIERRVVDRDDFQSAFDEYAARRDELDYEIDGVVFLANDVATQEGFGSTGHHPRYAIAYKFKSRPGETILNDIEWSVSRTGAITPVALIEPLELAGAVLSRASLHNVGYVTSLDLTRGARVVVTRRGDVIPKVESVIEAGDRPFEIPAVCPSCGAMTELRDDFLFCTTPASCRDAVIGRISHFVSVCEIEGFGAKSLRDAYDKGLLRAPVDLFKLTKESLLTLERTGEKTADNLLAQIDARRTLPLAAFLRSLGLHELGRKVSELLAEDYRTLERVRTVTVDELAAIHSIGDVIAETVVAGLKGASDAIDELLDYVTIAAPVHVEDDARPLAGRSFVFTGGLDAMKRSEAQKRVRALGAATPSGVSKTLDYLVCGVEKSGRKSSKQSKAEKLIADGAELTVLDEEGFLTVLEQTQGE